MCRGGTAWRKDAEVLELLTLLVGDITPEHDSKLQRAFPGD